jgi:hypothetical protein
MKKFESSIAICIICLLGVIFQHAYVNEFPSYTHAWAQGDRYALALGFVENNLDFFHPQTYVLNHQFPGNFEVPSAERITAVNFPIHDYIPAIFMKLFHSSAPCIFRIYILLYSFAALFFLFQLTQILTKDFYKSLFVLLFAACSPVFVYYQAGFLPTIPSLANAIIGLYFYVKYLQEGKHKNLNAAVAFLVLGSLARTTFLLPLIAVFGLEVLRTMKKEIAFKSIVQPFLIAAIVLFASAAYESHLQSAYGSLFLNHLLPAQNLQEAKEIIQYVYETWSLHYFSKEQYFLFVLVLLAALFLFFKKKTNANKIQRQIALLAGAYFLGCVLFAIAMLQQFPAHDYYFLDSFFLPILLVFILTLGALPHFNSAPRLFSLALLLLSVPLVATALQTQTLKRESGSWDRVAATTSNFEGSAEFLDALKIKRDATILVLDAYAPNIPFLLLRRKGFAVLSTSKENLQKALQWNFDYIVIQNEFFVSDIFVNYPEILSRITKIADNGKISVCALTPSKQDLSDFIGLKNKVPFLHDKITFDTVPNMHWQNTESTNAQAYLGKHAGLVTPAMDYGISYKSSEITLLQQRSSTLHLTAHFFTNKPTTAEIAVYIHSKGENIFYKTFALSDLLKTTKQWEKIDLLLYLPQTSDAACEFGININNNQHDSLYYDDVEFRLY